MSRCMFRASKGQDYSDPNNHKEDRKREEEHREETVTQGHTVGYWQNQEKNLSETEGSLSA